jgi:probable rRNA maturation factor
MSFSLTNKTKGNLAILKGLPFVQIKDAVLGKDYELSLVFVTPKEVARLNTTYRNKPLATDILSFPLDKNSGEIFMNMEEVKKESKKFERELKNFIQFLFIHGCVHLKGFTHGSRMESEERKFRKEFGV